MKPGSWQLWWRNWEVIAASRTMDSLNAACELLRRRREREKVPVVDGGHIEVMWEPHRGRRSLIDWFEFLRRGGN